MEKKYLQQKRTLATLATLLCLMPMTAQTTNLKTVINVMSKTAKVVQSSTLYVGEVVLDGQPSFCYLYSADLTNTENVFAAVKNGLSDFKGGAYKTLVPDIIGESEDKGIVVCSNTEYTTMMNADWKDAFKAGQACLPDATISSASSNNLYETDADFATKCRKSFDEDGVECVDNAGETWTFSGILGKLTATNTDAVTYTVENGQLIKHIDRYIDYTCESVTVIYTKVEFGSVSSLTDIEAKPSTTRLVCDLQGRRLQTPGKGIVIRQENGKTKKIIIK